MNESLFKIGLIVPLYNEGKRINIPEYERFIESIDTVKIVFVDDASEDNTLQIVTTVKEKHPSKVEVISNSTNLGKGAAIRKGMLYALENMNVSHLAFMDADLSVPLLDLIQFSKTLETSKAQVIFGVRNLSDINHVKRTFSRKYLSYFFRFYVKTVFQFKISDTQCGAKVFNREIVDILYQNRFKTRWLSDVELLLRLKNYCVSNQLNFSQQLISASVTYYEDRAGSKLNFFEMLRTAYDLMKLSVRYGFRIK